MTIRCQSPQNRSCGSLNGFAAWSYKDALRVTCYILHHNPKTLISSNCQTRSQPHLVTNFSLYNSCNGHLSEPVQIAGHEMGALTRPFPSILLPIYVLHRQSPSLIRLYECNRTPVPRSSGIVRINPPRSTSFHQYFFKFQRLFTHIRN